jgi:beta-lactamase superfamily II metal-dependent hydrolase
MEVLIFDVAHGFCAFVIGDNGNTMLIDAGHNDVTGFYPANYLLGIRCSGIERFFVTNYDEDHISGLRRLREFQAQIPIGILHRNKTITLDQLRALKKQGGPLGPGMSELLNMAEQYNDPVTNPPEYPNLEFQVFHNSYPTFQDTNNLSLVLFLHYPGLSMVFPGDLEKAGWKELLKQKAFQDNLARVNVFVASHHGRENGYEESIFNFCNPNIILISDESKKYDTQEVNYSKHSTGISWNTTETRNVLTTRNDGMIRITKKPEAGFYITTSK